jgi:methionine-rich copper-binding protein CopC
MKLDKVAPFVLIAGVLLGAWAPSGQAHAIVVTSTPTANAVVPPGRLDVAVNFNTRLDRDRSRLVLERPDGHTQAIPLREASVATAIGGQGYVRMPGRWKLRWQVLAADGHITRGDIPFVVRPEERTRP